MEELFVTAGVGLLGYAMYLYFCWRVYCRKDDVKALEAVVSAARFRPFGTKLPPAARKGLPGPGSDAEEAADPLAEEA